MKTVAIVIPSLHRPDLTARCIESIQRQTVPHEKWKIVVENEARSGSVLPDPLPPNTIRIELPANYDETIGAARDTEREKRLEARLKRQAKQLGYDLVPTEEKPAA